MYVRAILAEGLFVTLVLMIVGLWGWLVAIVLLFHMITVTYCIGSDRRIRSRNRQSSLEILPEVTVIVAARDEQQAIGQTLHMLLELDYPKLRVIAVDDRSSDQTGLIMDNIADSDERLLVHHVQLLWGVHGLAASEGRRRRRAVEPERRPGHRVAGGDGRAVDGWLHV